MLLSHNLSEGGFLVNKKKKAWNKFKASGKIKDYLDYKKISDEE